MFRSTPHLVAARFENRAPFMGLVGACAVIGLALAIIAQGVLGSALLPLLAFALAGTFAGYGLALGYPHQTFGMCNNMTLIRVALVAFLFGGLFATAKLEWIMFFAAILAFALDGVDGWIARRTAMTSAFGARFDMETDAGLAATISVWVLVHDVAGPEILILGFMRYAFVAASFLWPALQQQLPESFRRKIVCVLQIATLIVVIFPLSPVSSVMPMVVIAVLLLVWSFTVDILWLVRRAP